MIASWSTTSETLESMIHGFEVTQALHVMAQLRIADHLSDGPRSVEEIAGIVDADARALHRVLRLLASVGVFAEDAPGQFAITPMAEHLRQGVPGSLWTRAVLVGGSSFWSSWGDLLTTVRTGETAFPRVHGMNRWEYLVRHPDEGAIFDAAMTANTALDSTAVADAYDFSSFGLLADVGGGQGGLLASILSGHPSLRGLLFDRPQVVAGAPDLLARAGVAERCDVVGGDFFETVPSGADAYLLKCVIHDWGDAPATAILRTCRSAMGDGAKLLLAESVITSGSTPEMAKYRDLMMMVMNGGRERTVDEFAQVMGAAGFRLSGVVPTAGPLSILEGVPA